MQWVIPAFSLWAALILRLLFAIIREPDWLRLLLGAGILALLIAGIIFAWRVERRADGKLYRILPPATGNPPPERSGKKLKRMIWIALLIHIILFVFQ